MERIILISGKQGSGKTTLQTELALNLFHRHNKKYVKLNFADILYKMHDEVLVILNSYYPPRKIVKDGPLLQLLGTEWGRKTISENIWVDCLRSKIDQMKSVDGVIIGDCRFENEFDMFKDALRVRLECREDLRQERCSMWRTNTQHPSETSLDRYSAEGFFDLYLNTDETNINGCVELTLAQLNKNNWKDRLNATKLTTR